MSTRDEYKPPQIEVQDVHGRKYRKVVIDPPWARGFGAASKRGAGEGSSSDGHRNSQQPEMLDSHFAPTSSAAKPAAKAPNDGVLVINIKSGKPYDVYIGRRHKDIIGSDWKWGNPFAIGRDGDRKEVIEKYEQWMLEPEQAEFLKEAKQTLVGKVLGCWCSPLPCHGDVLAKLVNSGVSDSKCAEDYQEEGTDSLHIIKETPTTFLHRFDVTAESIPFIVGKDAHTLKGIMRDTSTTITVKDAKLCVEIRGENRSSVIEARTRVNIAIIAAADKLPYTHFISIPLTSNASVQDRLVQFGQQAVGLQTPNLDASILNPVKKLHLTCITLRLHAPSQLASVQEALRQLTPAIQKMARGSPLSVHLQDLAIMNDDVTEANVVYLKLVEDEGLQLLRSVCGLIIDRLRSEDLLTTGDIEHQNLLNENGNVSIKFHATVINTKNRKPQNKQRTAFDATSLLQSLGSLDLGTVEVPELHLSQMQGKDSQGYYPCVLAVPFV